VAVNPSDTEGAWLAVVLAWVGGAVDAVGFLTLANLFTSHMSGNSAALGAYLGVGQGAEALRRLTPIPLFVLGVAMGAAVIELAVRRGVRSSLSVALALEAILLLAFRVYGRSHLHAGVIQTTAGWQFDLLVALLAVPMGVQTAALQRVAGTTVHTTYITQMLTTFAKEAVAYLFWLHDRGQAENASATQGIVPARPSLFRALFVAGVWTAFVVGAVMGGAAVARWDLNALLAPMAVLVAMIALDLRSPLYTPTS